MILTKLKEPLFIILAVGSLTACATTGIPDSSFNAPLYSGYVTPITTAITPRYRPTSQSYRVVYWMKISAKNGSRVQRATQKTEMDVTETSTQIGNLLSWEININKFVQNGRVEATNVPLFTIKQLTDQQGNSQGMNITSPALEAQHASQKKIGEAISVFRKALKSPFTKGSFVEPLPSHGIKTGDSITVGDNTTALTSWARSLHGTLIPGNNFLAKKVLGWGEWHGQKVIVVSINGAVRARVSFSPQLKDLPIQLTLSGYELVDPTTFMLLRSDGVGLLSSQSTNSRSLSAKMRMTFDAVPR